MSDLLPTARRIWVGTANEFSDPDLTGFAAFTSLLHQSRRHSEE